MAKEKKNEIIEEVEETLDEEIEEETTEDEEVEEIEEDIEDEEIEEAESDDDIEINTNPMKNTMSDKTRSIIIGVVSLVLVALIVVIAVFGNSKTTTSSTEPSKESRDTSTDSLKEFYKAFDSKDLKLIFFARATCGYCTLQKPILERIAKDYDIDYYAIDTDTLKSNEVNEIIKALGIQGATPTSVIVKEGKVVATNEGYLDGIPYVEFLAKNGIVDKDATYKPEEELEKISYSDFKDIAKKDKNSLVLLDTSACSECSTVRSLLNDLAKKNDFKVNYLYAPSLSSDEVNDLVETDLKKLGYDAKAYKKDKQVEIPLLLVVKDNKIKDYVLKSTEKSDYTKVLKKYGFIK